MILLIESTNEGISNDNENIIIDGKKIRIYAEADPSKLPWSELGIDVVFECTGFFTSKEKAEAHISAGAKKLLFQHQLRVN